MFNGTTQWLNLGTNLPLLNGAVGATIMIWCHPQVPPPTTGVSLFSLSIGPPSVTPTGTSRLALELSTVISGAIRAVVRNADSDGGSVLDTGAGVTNSGDRNHLAIAYNAVLRTIFCYVNGVQVSTGIATAATGTAFSATNCANGAIAAGDDGSSFFFNGQLEDARVYNRFLGPNEILTIYSSLGRDSAINGLIARYPMKELGDLVPVVAAANTAGETVGSLGGALPVGAPTYAPRATSTRSRPTATANRSRLLTFI